MGVRESWDFSPDELIERLDDHSLAGVAAALEIRQRVRKIQSTRLAAQYLLARDDMRKLDAFSGLMAVAWRAKGNLFVVPDDQGHLMVGHGPTERSNTFWATREFIQEKILELLAPHYAKDAKSVLRAALSDEFRYIPRLVRLRLIDRVRRHMRCRQPGVILSLNFAFEDGEGKTEFGDYIPFDLGLHGSTLDTSGKVRDHDLENFPQFLVRNERRLRTLLGEAKHQTLEAIVLAHYDGPERTRRGRKGKTTRAIAHHRGISEQQARADKRKLLKVCSASLDPILGTVYRFLQQVLDVPQPEGKAQEGSVLSFSQVYPFSSQKPGAE